MSEYSNVRLGKLVLKGEKICKRKRKRKSTEKKKLKNSIDPDAIKHGGWYKVEKLDEVVGSIAIEFEDNTYVKALNNGLLTLGTPHKEGEGPSPEEIFTAFIINETKIVMKSGYGKYVKIESNGIVTGRSEAVSCTEQWKPIFQNGKVAILGDNGCFMSIDTENNSCVALNKTLKEDNLATIRCYAPQADLADEAPSEEKSNLAQVEVNYVKKFQKFQDKKIRVNKNDIKELELAKDYGKLHEKLLDRRSKMKADRYCK